jgi:VanZ family protein
VQQLTRVTRTSWVRALPALAWMLAIFVMSAQHGVPTPLGFSAELIAVAGHLVSYGLLAVLILWALPERGRWSRRRYLLAVLLATLYGISDELHQSFVPGRSATPFDVAIDALGATLAVCLAVGWQHVGARGR